MSTSTMTATTMITVVRFDVGGHGDGDDGDCTYLEEEAGTFVLSISAATFEPKKNPKKSLKSVRHNEKTE